MTSGIRIGSIALALAFSVLSIPAATAQSSKPAAPTTLSFNWEAASGRANILVWPFRPGGRYEQLVTQHTNGTASITRSRRTSWTLEADAGGALV